MSKKDEDDYRPFVFNLNALLSNDDHNNNLVKLRSKAKERMECLENPANNMEKIKEIYDLDEKKYKDYTEEAKKEVYITRAKKDYETMHGAYLGFISTMNLLEELWACVNLREIRDKLAIGLVKDTIAYGNTSVSMGVAVEHFSKLDGNNNDVVLLNCGTGGIKYQHYVRQDGIIRAGKEYKPENQTGPNSLKIKEYVPMKEVDGKKIESSISFERNQLQFVNELTGFLSDSPNKENVSKFHPISLHAPIIAFVTGSVRAKWEKESTTGKKPYDDYMEKYFGGFSENEQDMKSDDRIAIKIPYSSNKYKSYYMEQYMEGNLELSGTRQMYNNILSADKLNKGTAVVASVGIGRGSCQFSIYNDYINEIKIYGVGKGMAAVDNNERMVLTKEFGKAVVYGIENDKMNHFFNMCKNNITYPVIALKSGASLFLEKNPDIKYSLLKLANPSKTIIS